MGNVTEDSDRDLDSMAAAYLAWLTPAGFWLVVLAAAVAPLVLAHFPHAEQSRQDWLQRCGLVVQLLGFWTVWKQLREAIQDYQQPGLRMRATSWWKARPRSQPVVVGLSGVAAGTSMGSLFARLRRDKGDGSVDARLRAIEFNFGELEKELDALRERTQREANDLSVRLQDEKNARSAADRDLGTRLQKQAVGSADWQLVGLIWFVSGSIYSTVPDSVLSVLGL
jgi:hypothetical protein